jgi:hypothetical protein
MAEPRDFDPAELPEYADMDPTGHVDLAQIDCNLALTPAERIRQYEMFLEMARAFRQAGMRHYGFDPALDPPAE